MRQVEGLGASHLLADQRQVTLLQEEDRCDAVAEELATGCQALLLDGAGAIQVFDDFCEAGDRGGCSHVLPFMCGIEQGEACKKAYVFIIAYYM